MSNEIKKWFVEGIPGNGRGSVLFNTELPITDKKTTNLVITSMEGYDEDEDYDDFGSQYYCVRCTGTEDQLKQFIQTMCFDDEELMDNVTYEEE